jgi:F0F1-type ATP synthase alpha subunit
MSMEEQVVIIYAGTNGFVDDYPVAALGRYETELLSFLKSRKADVLNQLKSVGDLKDIEVEVTGPDGKKVKKKEMGALEKSLADALTEFAKQFSVEDKK